MKKIIITIFAIILIAGLVISLEQLSHSINLDKEKKDILETIGINEPIIKRDCIKIDNFTCKANVYQKGGINKDIKINYHYCNNWSEQNESEVYNETFISECLEWITLNQTEIENIAVSKTEELLSEIAGIQINREINRNESREILTDEIAVEINSK